MKKTFLIFIVLIVFSVVLSSCVKTEDLLSHASYLERDMLCGATDGYEIEAIVGKDAEGDFCRIRLFPTNVGGIDSKITLNIDGSVYSLEKSPSRYALELMLRTAVSPTTLRLNVDGAEIDVNLNSVIVDCIDYTAALQSAATEFAQIITPEKNQEFGFDVQIKIVADKLGDKPFYYYVTFSSPEKKLAALIEPYSGEIVAKKS